MRIKRFVNDAPQVEQLSTWGFEHPRLEVALNVHGGAGTSTRIFFGNQLPEDASLVYAKRNDEPALYAVAASDVDQLKRDPHGLRATSCFEFFTSQVSKVTVAKSNATEWTIERVDGRWQHSGSNQTLETTRVEEWLGKLADLRLAGFVDDAPSDLALYGLAPAAGTITIWTTDRQDPQRLLVGSTVEGSANRYGRIEDRAAVVRLPDLITQLLNTAPDTFQPSATPQPSETQ